MLQSTFQFLPNITATKEKQLWKQNIKTWDEFMKAKTIKGLTTEQKRECDLILQQAKYAILEDKPSFFTKLPQKEMWRLYQSFKNKLRFLDIEIINKQREILVVSIADGFETKSFVRNHSLTPENLKKELEQDIILVTFNGSSFDLPILERYCKTAFALPHIDLKHLCIKLGFKGGLKEVEKQLNIQRPQHLYGNPSEVYRTFMASQDKEYLELIVQYNEEDTINLKPVLEKVYPQALKHLQEQLMNGERKAAT